MSDLIELTALWLKKKKDGEPYFSGKLGSANIVVFKNKSKKEAKHPDYKIFVSPPWETKGDKATKAEKESVESGEKPAMEPAKFDDDDIPF